MKKDEKDSREGNKHRRKAKNTQHVYKKSPHKKRKPKQKNTVKKKL